MENIEKFLFVIGNKNAQSKDIMIGLIHGKR